MEVVRIKKRSKKKNELKKGGGGAVGCRERTFDFFSVEQYSVTFSTVFKP